MIVICDTSAIQNRIFNSPKLAKSFNRMLIKSNWWLLSLLRTSMCRLTAARRLMPHDEVVPNLAEEVRISWRFYGSITCTFEYCTSCGSSLACDVHARPPTTRLKTVQIPIQRCKTKVPLGTFSYSWVSACVMHKCFKAKNIDGLSAFQLIDWIMLATGDEHMQLKPQVPLATRWATCW